MENFDLQLLKKYYGERFSHMCREMFPIILEEEGKLSKIISEKFAKNFSLYDDIIATPYSYVAFKNFIYNIYHKEKGVKEVEKNDLSAKELLDKAGYVLYPECKTEEDVQAFKKYYAPKEVLCTFNGGRLNHCRVWFAVKKDVDKIKRENFTSPMREDEYGTSVISIQFTKTKPSTLSIKNRYNHTVQNPDATFLNNLDNIAKGLSVAFASDYNLNYENTNDDFFLNNYIQDQNGKFHKYSFEYNNIYYCQNNIIIDNGVSHEIDKKSCVLADRYIFDTKNKVVYDYEGMDKAFVNSFGKIDKIEVKSKKDNKQILVTPKNGEVIVVDVCGPDIVGLKNPNVVEIEDDFLYNNVKLKNLDMPNVVDIGNNCLYFNLDMKEVNFPQLESVGSNFLVYNSLVSKLETPKLTKVGDNFLNSNTEITKLDLPNLNIVGDAFISFNNKINDCNMKNLKKVGYRFLSENKELEEIDFPNLEEVGSNFISYNLKIDKCNFEKLKKAGSGFLESNQKIKSLNLPNLEAVDDRFLMENMVLSDFTAKKLKNVGNEFLLFNLQLKNLNLPELKKVGNNFVGFNAGLETLLVPNLQTVSDGFLKGNESIKELNLPAVEQVGKNFLWSNKTNLKILNLPNFININNSISSIFDDDENENQLCSHNLHGFLASNTSLEQLNMPKNEEFKKDVLQNIKANKERQCKKNVSTNAF